MTDRWHAEDLAKMADMNAVDRINYPEGVVLIADGASDDPSEAFMTMWFFGRSEDKLDIARKLYFKPWGELGPNNLDIRMNAAAADADEYVSMVRRERLRGQMAGLH